MPLGSVVVGIGRERRGETRDGGIEERGQDLDRRAGDHPARGSIELDHSLQVRSTQCQHV
eukprot:3844925-Rhodomonas_salina.3